MKDRGFSRVVSGVEVDIEVTGSKGVDCGVGLTRKGLLGSIGTGKNRDPRGVE